MSSINKDGGRMKAQDAKDIFESGLECSQAVFTAFSGSYGIDRNSSLKLSLGLHAGMCEAGVCGAVSAAVLVIGLKYGHTNAKDQTIKNTCIAKVREFLSVFRERNEGRILCRDILDCDIFTPEGLRKATDEELFTIVCTDMVVKAATILEEQGY